MLKYIISVTIIYLCLQQSYSQCSTWKVQREGGDGHGYYDLQFIDSLHGWVGRTEIQGDNSLLLRTIDGGKSWEKPIIEDGYGRFTSISFIDSLNGWGGADWQLLRTRDGGKTWKIIHELPWLGLNPTFGKIFFIDSLHGWGIGGDTNGVNASRVFRTTDGGKNWDIKQLLNINVYKIAFVDTIEGWLAGNQLLHTSNGGKSWENQNVDSAQVGSVINDVMFINRNRGWAPIWADSKSWMLSTSDGGKTWSNLGVIDIANSHLHVEKICFINSFEGWLFGWIFYQGGLVETIYKTTDGGKQWQRQSLDLSTTLITGIAIDRCRAYALADDGVVLTLDNTTNVIQACLIVPESISLSQNYPNPFNPSTTINYKVTRRENVLLELYDELGKKQQTLVNEIKDASEYTYRFNASSLSSGIYFYRLTTPSTIISKKMIVIK